MMILVHHDDDVDELLYDIPHFYKLMWYVCQKTYYLNKSNEVGKETDLIAIVKTIRNHDFPEK